LRQLSLGSNLKRFLSVVVGLSLVAAILTGCATPSSVIPNTHVTIAEVGTFTTLNADVASSSANKIASDISALTLQNFYEVNQDAELVANKTFGTVKITKQEPFTVTYTLAKTALWSDGSSVDATDIALAVTAAKYQNFGSTQFGSTLSGAAIVGQPKPGANELSVSFPNPIANWRTVLKISAAAHVVGKVAGITGNVATVRSGIVSAISSKDEKQLEKLGLAYAESFSPSSDITNFVTNGAYTITKVSATAIELDAVREFGGSHSAVAAKVFVNLFTDNASALKAVATAKADLFAPLATLNEPQSDLVNQSQTLDAKKIKVLAPTSGQSEQFLLNLSGFTFSDATYNSPKTGAILRQAFLNMIPKARANDFAAVTQVITRSDSFIYSSASKNYSAVSASNGSANYLLQDVEKATELVASAKLSFVPVVKVLFDTDDQSAVAEWTLLSDHASNAGFRLMNISAEDPSQRYNNNAYDVYIGKVPQMGVGFGSIQQLVSGPNRMPQEQFLGLTADVIAADAKSLDAKLQALDQKLFKIGIGLPMYQVPTLLVYNQRIKGLVADPTATNSTWGYWTWQVSSDK